MVLEAAILAVTFGAGSAQVDSATAKEDSSSRLSQASPSASADTTHGALMDSLRSIAIEIQRIEGLMSRLRAERQHRDIPTVILAAPDNMPVVIPGVSKFRMPVIAPTGDFPMPILTPKGWRFRRRAIDSTVVESSEQSPRE